MQHFFLFRELHRSKWAPTFNIPSTFPEISTPSLKTPDDIFSTPKGNIMSDNSGLFRTPVGYSSQISEISNMSSSSAEYKTPDTTFNTKQDVFSHDFVQLQKSPTFSTAESSTFKSVELRFNSILIENNYALETNVFSIKKGINMERRSCDDDHSLHIPEGVLRSKSDFEIPKAVPVAAKSEGLFQNLVQKSDSLFSFLTPLTKRKNNGNISGQSTPTNKTGNGGAFIVPASPIPKHRRFPANRTTSLNSLKSGNNGLEVQPNSNTKR